MTVTENYMLQQTKQMASAMTSLPQTGSKDKADGSSFQEMMEQTQKDVKQPAAKDESGKPVQSKGEQDAQETETAPVQKEEKEELRPQDMTANPNAVSVMDLFRPEITETAAEETAIPAPIEALPEETVEETAMHLDGQAPTLDTSVESSVDTETPMGEQQESFQEALQEPLQADGENTVQPARQEAEPQAAEKTASRDGAPQAEVSSAQDESEEIKGDAPQPEQPLFRENQATPVKVGESYETVDTQKPDMEAKLADTIRQAAQAGAERVEIKLTPVNLGALTIEMTKDASGALQVVLHASNSRAAGLLSQHLDGLHAALQSYGGDQEVHVEVQRGQESQEQHFQQADPDGRGQQQSRQQEEHRQEDHAGGEDFLQKLRLGLFGTEEL